MKNIYELVAEKDNRNIENIRELIDLANDWVDDIYNTVNSDKSLSRSEWEQLRKVARQYINHLKKIADPRKKIFLHLQENQTMSESLSKRLEQTLIVAIDRLVANIDVIESKILTSKNIIKVLSLEERAIIAVYNGEIITRNEGKIYQHYSFYMDRDNRIKDNKRIDTQRKICNYFKRIEKIIPYLLISVQQKANDELSILKANLGK